jgi:AcrR family transcriptional regulator
MAKKPGESGKRLPAPQRKKIILDAAIRTFVEYGYHGAVMDTIAERANVTKPILYRHFKSKLDLFFSIIDQAGEDLINSLSQPLPGQVEWRDRIRYDVESYVDFTGRFEMAFRLIYETDTNVDKRVSERVSKIRHEIIDLVSNQICDYTDTNAVSMEEIKVTAIMIVGMVESTVIHWLNNHDLPLDVYREYLVNGVISILAKLPPRAR